MTKSDDVMFGNDWQRKLMELIVNYMLNKDFDYSD